MANFLDLLRNHQQEKREQPTSESVEEEYLGLLEEEGADKQTDTAVSIENDSNLLSEETEKPKSESSAKPIATEADKQWLNQCVHHIATVFKTATKKKACDTSALSDHIKAFLISLPKSADQLAILELMISEKEAKIQSLYGGLVTKSIMLMLYTIKMGLQLRLEHDELHALIMAGILHHIGLAQVPAGLLDKKEKLSKAEFKLISQGPELGEKYLQQCGISDKRILSAALQARERFDGSGPGKLKGDEISSTARIIGLLSLFQALIHFRAYRKRLLPRDAIREILIKHKKSYDPAFLKGLIEAISLYPVGTYVQLNSGDIGQVVRVRDRLPLRPVVHLTMNRKGDNITARDIDLQSQPNLMVERCMYPEDLKDL